MSNIIKIPMTQDQYNELLEEYNRLMAIFNSAMAQGNDIKSYEYTTTKEARDNHLTLLSSHLAHVSDKLNRAEIIESPKLEEGIVNHGDIVEIAITINGVRTIMSKTLVVDITDPISQMSYESPIAQAIIGKPIGSIQSCSLPNGQCTVEILATYKQENRGR